MFDNCAYKIVNTKMEDYLDDNFLSHYWHFNHGFKFENFVFSGFHDLKILCLNISNTAVITVKNVDYRCIIMMLANLKQFICSKILFFMIVDIYKKKHINIKNRICKYSDKLIESQKTETENISINEKNYKDLVIYFTNYVNSKSIKMLNLSCHELTKKKD